MILLSQQKASAKSCPQTTNLHLTFIPSINQKKEISSFRLTAFPLPLPLHMKAQKEAPHRRCKMSFIFLMMTAQDGLHLRDSIIKSTKETKSTLSIRQMHYGPRRSISLKQIILAAPQI